MKTLLQQDELLSDISDSIAQRSGHPVLGILASFPIACFTCALFTDVAYVQTARIMWADFSAWLLAVGLAGSMIAAISGLVSLALNWRRRQRSVWPIALGSLVIIVIAAFNNLVHSRDAWTSVMPTGLALSAATVLITLPVAWFAFGPSPRRGAAMQTSGVRQ